MLVDVTLLRPDPILRIIGGGTGGAERVQRGVYRCGHWNFEMLFRRDRRQSWSDFSLGDFSEYGVCDGPEQLVETLPAEVTSGPGKYVVSMVRLCKEDEPAEGGWRWHKWGPYVGKQDPQCEYLAHEPVIREVWTYHIYEVRDSEIASGTGAGTGGEGTEGK